MTPDYEDRNRTPEDGRPKRKTNQAASRTSTFIALFESLLSRPLLIQLIGGVAVSILIVTTIEIFKMLPNSTTEMVSQRLLAPKILYSPEKIILCPDIQDVYSVNITEKNTLQLTAPVFNHPQAKWHCTEYDSTSGHIEKLSRRMSERTRIALIQAILIEKFPTRTLHNYPIDGTRDLETSSAISIYCETTNIKPDVCKDSASVLESLLENISK